MTGELVLEHPHVHDWLCQPVAAGEPARWEGPVGETSPPIFCSCGEVAGDWSEVTVTLSIEGEATLAVADLWPDGDHPKPVTAKAVAELARAAGLDRVLEDWGVLSGGVTLQAEVFDMSASANLT